MRGLQWRGDEATRRRHQAHAPADDRRKGTEAVVRAFVGPQPGRYGHISFVSVVNAEIADEGDRVAIRIPDRGQQDTLVDRLDRSRFQPPPGKIGDVALEVV